MRFEPLGKSVAPGGGGHGLQAGGDLDRGDAKWIQDKGSRSAGLPHGTEEGDTEQAEKPGHRH